ncbi:MAG: hypothetical protein Q8897_01995 [Sweet potato little leaf phytoplasma]|uniref:Uncharacterized protein n=2 Tax=16SrII (Peanut WB group) TaxID=85621 RepID=A0A9K3STI9_9MOLU|nr:MULTISPECIES: hypothetical protein [Phytoplasma]MCG3566855.1 hypothetical protein [Sesame phyllody phytoplasma]MDO7987299.1 hypothetical protein [Sweet potato little leaf phytoplasma]MDO8005516.1 hypothetical protein [Sweet potato little leaf phytoplasma]MDO8008843.1 hypothetical protein [Sweet potato little leaf phytoplasma]MDO8020537.1 hypothetical protein [Sweet potato little leaf phytoplasma]
MYIKLISRVTFLLILFIILFVIKNESNANIDNNYEDNYITSLEEIRKTWRSLDPEKNKKDNS